MTVAAIVLAGGRGERLGLGVPKGFAPLAGRPLLLWSLEALAATPEVDRVVPVLPEGETARFEALDTASIPGLEPPAIGGALRQDSVAAGLAAVDAEVDWVAVHDAARCLVAPPDVSRAIAAARETGAAILGRPVRDTIKQVRDGLVVATPERAECWAAFTPQVFRRELLEEALAKARADGVVGTDDAQLVERLGVRVRMVEGPSAELKVTFPSDVAAAEAALRGAGSAGGPR